VKVLLDVEEGMVKVVDVEQGRNDAERGRRRQYAVWRCTTAVMEF